MQRTATNHPPRQMSEGSARNKLIPGCLRAIDVVSNRLSKIQASRGCQSTNT